MRIALRGLRLSSLYAAAPVAMIWLLSGCGPAYGPMSLEGGYQDVELEPGVHYVDYRGAPGLARETVVDYWRRRAMELCPAGYEIFANDGTPRAEPNVSETAGVVSASGRLRCTD